jgi:hypothetical protein
VALLALAARAYAKKVPAAFICRQMIVAILWLRRVTGIVIRTGPGRFVLSVDDERVIEKTGEEGVQVSH